MPKSPETADVHLSRDVFFRNLLRELAGTLEDVVGLDGAEGYISTVGTRIGSWIDAEYRRELAGKRYDASTVAEICIDLKRRIGGDFYLIESDQKKLVFGNRACPFGDRVIDRPSLCMMTSNVFGRIAADNLGYSRVDLEETIALGHRGCRVVVYLERDAATEPTAREYFRSYDPSLTED